MLNKLEKFAKKYRVPLFNKNSKFPDYYATHELYNVKMLNDDYLLCSELAKKRRFSCEIDRYLGATNYVFFALGKGYLKTTKSIGLIYDPLILADVKGANIVMNDLLHVLGETDVLQKFCNKHLDLLIKTLRKNYGKLGTKKSKEEIINIFTRNLSLGKNLLVAETKEDILYGNIFELLLKLLPKRVEKELKSILTKSIIQPNTINNGIKNKIRRIFVSQQSFLNKFFDETTEERMIELRVPKKHKITKGLIGIYYA